MPQTTNNSLTRFKNAFASLLISRPLSTITVQDIVRKAGVNRSTFYRHFLDLDDFLDWLEEEMLVEITTHFQLSENKNIDFTQFYQYTNENRILLQGFLETNRWNHFIDRLQTIVLKNYLKLLSTQATTIPIEIQVQFFIGGHINLFKWWLDQENPPTPEKMATYHQKLSQPR
ncbi:hypothetical protein AYR54_09950 [Loigolactobacillus backii]|uniref:TetR/AcrR family transcriptional regulator n=1 Tax=Loigolactobacillus TaxID=2767889 RepID=UPI0007F0C49E|nr:MULTISPECIES: TetR/AcrR family transcriptional regulator [Loigolactobacillus]ANK60577.1 hypothetical protein AYR52_10145 [Loigolactobacillus backii]ANK65530.1 hypothetical protein AYR54_09950 [Loigolactobacillus backii]ANK68001.1 hypothetical protein AYR55_10070 [Loigolactobacillus backii]PIO86777.1 hypothetical protein B8A32_06270 [Loigolactobacillus backii]